MDHDFPSAGEDTLIPHGIYDLARNEGYIHLNTSHDTSEFCCDGGGSNASHRSMFKEALQKLSDQLGLEIRIAHYPPYCSKHNPIEHRLFPHITVLVRASFFIHSLSPNTLWRRQKRLQD